MAWATAMAQPELYYEDTRELKLESGQHMELSCDDYYGFVYVWKDNVRIRMEEGKAVTEASIPAGSWSCLPAMCKVVLENRSFQSTQITLIRFRCRERLGRSGRPAAFRMPQAQGWLREFLRASDQPAPADYLRLQSYLYAMAAVCSECENRGGRGDGDLASYVKEARKLMQEQFHETIDVDEIAQLCGASPSRFYQAFKLETGLSPHKYLTMIRLKMSLALLASGTGSMKETAHAVGYSDELYFSRLFKKNMGLSPTDYMVRAQKRVANLCQVFEGDLEVLGITPEVSLRWGWNENPDLYLREIERSEPELILCPPVSDKLQRTLSGIGPVLMLNWKMMSWQERLTHIAETLDLTSVAERWMSFYEQKVANARALVSRKLGERPYLLVYAGEQGNFRVFGQQRRKLKDLFYDELGICAPAVATEIGFYDATSLEAVADIDCGNVLFLVHEGLPANEHLRLEQQWRSIKEDVSGVKRCLFVRYRDTLNYNPAVYEELVDSLVETLNES